METFALYLFKSAVWLTGFIMIYFLFLRNERFFMLNRFYLVSGLLISFIFPLISIHYTVELPAVTNTEPVDFSTEMSAGASPYQQVVPIKSIDYRIILASLYFSGVLFFAIRVILHILSLCHTIKRSKIDNLGQVKMIRSSEFSGSFSFFNYVFINPSVNETEREEIMNHELVHIRQMHWFDLILVELLCLFQWANPFAWIYTRFIRMNHEYLADEVALRQTSDPAVYRAALVNEMFNTQVFSLSNSFNYSLSKKRFDMMKKIISSPYRKLKVLFVVPVIAFLFYAFAKPQYNYSTAADNPMSILQTQAKTASTVSGIVVNEEETPLPGATVIISGTHTGVTTDSSGRFIIENVTENVHLIVSSEGCVSQYLEPSFSSEMKVRMLLDKGNSMSLLIRSTFKNGPYPLIKIDGVESNKKFDEIDQNEIKGMAILSGENASKLYGEKGKNGVIEISTKKKDTESIENKPAEMADQESIKIRSIDGSTVNSLIVIDGVVREKRGSEGLKEINVSDISDLSVIKGKLATDKYGEIGQNGVIIVTTKKKNAGLFENKPAETGDQESIKLRSIDGSTANPLIVIDGVVSEKKGKEGVNGIYPNNIFSINVLKDNAAIDKYGENAKEGVIEITTKKNPVVMNQQVVKGVVLKEDGKPLVGVNVTCTGKAGEAFLTETGSDGRFTMSNIKADASLLFSCRGYKGLTLKPVFTSEMTIKMERDPDYKTTETRSGSDKPAAQKTIPMVVIDGVISEKSFGDARKELGYNLGIIKMVMGKEATDKYGDKGVNGVYEITTRVKALEMGLKPPFQRLAPEDFPTFQGQKHFSFKDWVADQVKYPVEAQENKLEGWVTVNFKVELDGSVTDIVSTSGVVSPVLVNEIIAIIRSSPKWDKPKNPSVDESFSSSITMGFHLPDQIDRDAPFVVVEKMPHYPGGDVELLNFIKNNTIYPEAAKSAKIQGRVILRFIVSKAGKAEGISILKGVDPLLDAEAVRVVSMLTGFTPGMQDGNVVNVWYMVPVNFSLPPLVPANFSLTPSELIFSKTSLPEILKFTAMNTGYPQEAKNSSDTGRIFVVVKMDKGGIIKECKAVKERSEISVPVLPEVVIIGYATATNPGDLRSGKAAGKSTGKGYIALQNESVRVANKLGEIDIPEWKENNMEFALVFKFVLK
jgi:TonB family protein